MNEIKATSWTHTQTTHIIPKFLIQAAGKFTLVSENY